VTRGCGKHGNRRPNDFLESFRHFVENNLNTLPALLVVQQRPRDLTREDLRKLKLALDQAVRASRRAGPLSPSSRKILVAVRDWTLVNSWRFVHRANPHDAMLVKCTKLRRQVGESITGLAEGRRSSSGAAAIVDLAGRVRLHAAIQAASCAYTTHRDSLINWPRHRRE
jgi:hypothetical protein